MGLNRYSYSENDPVDKLDPNGNFWGAASKLVKLAVKGGDVAATFADAVEDFKIVTRKGASLSTRVVAAASLVSEIVSPVSVRDAKALEKGVGLIGSKTHIPAKGGKIGDLKGGVNQANGIECRHCPSNASSPLSDNAGPKIQMD